MAISNIIASTSGIVTTLRISHSCGRCFASLWAEEWVEDVEFRQYFMHAFRVSQVLVGWRQSFGKSAEFSSMLSLPWGLPRIRNFCILPLAPSLQLTPWFLQPRWNCGAKLELEKTQIASLAPVLESFEVLSSLSIEGKPNKVENGPMQLESWETLWNPQHA